MKFLVFLMTALLLAVPSKAQGVREPVVEGEVTFDPQCFPITNEAPYAMRGSVITNYFTNREGVRTRHMMNFKLESGESAEFCSTGPFYEGRMIYLVLREAIPVFSCLTRITGPVIIKGRIDPSGRRHTNALCL